MNTIIIIFAVIGILNCISLIGVLSWRLFKYKRNKNDDILQSDIEKQTDAIKENN